MNLPLLHRKSLNVMAGFFSDKGSLPPTFMGLAEDQRLHMIVIPDYPKKRSLYENLLRGYFYLHKITQYAYCAEAWMREATAADMETMADGRRRLSGPPPSQHPNRIEVLVTGAVDKDSIIHEAFMIDRSGARPKIGGPWKGPKGMPAGEKPQVMREGLNSLIDIEPSPLARSEAGMKVIRVMLEDATQRGYFPVIHILTPAQYDDMTN